MPRAGVRDRRRKWWEDGSFKEYAKFQAYKNKWRMGSWVTMEDLAGESYVVFLKILKQYPHVQDPPHIMKLYKLALLWRYHHLSKRWGVEGGSTPENHQTNEVDVEMCEGFAFQEMELALELSRLPVEVVALVKAMLFDDPKMLAHLWTKSHRKWSYRETNATRYKRLSNSEDVTVGDRLLKFLRGYDDQPDGNYTTN